MSRSSRRAGPDRERSGLRGSVEWALLICLLAWLVWLPLPFGAIVESAQGLLIAIPLAICAMAALARLVSRRPITLARPLAIWSGGALLFALIVTLQIVPLGESLVRTLSPASARIWSDGRTLWSLTSALPASSFPRVFTLSIAPHATRLHLFRFLGYTAALIASSLLVTSHRRRALLAGTLCTGALAEVLYGVREAALRRYEIWGWKNTLIFNRVTGTFVNPNHFGHYLAIVLPMALFLVVAAWYGANRAPGGRLGEKIARLAERRLVPAVFGATTALLCLAGILMAQSRGALLSALGGLAVAGVGILMRRRRGGVDSGLLLRFFGTAVLVALLLLGLVAYLGSERTVERFRPNEVEQQTGVGRLTGIRTGLALWDDFSILGSGLGTFEELALIYQTADFERLVNHAHCDYVEILATTGVGFLVAFVSIAAGYVWLWRLAFYTPPESRKHQAFLAAAVASIAIALIHAAFDFNFFIPANPATLAAIAGAAVATRE